MPAHPTRALVARHETLVIHFEALLKQVSAVAARRPEAPISGEVRSTAETLLYDCRPFIERGRAERLPAAAPDQAGLATQLGQVLAGLAAYETRWTEWDPRQKCFCWVLRDERLPVRRLRPQVTIAKEVAEPAEMLRIRQKLAERIKRQLEGEYKDGYRDGLAAAAAKSAADAAAAPDATGPRLSPL